MSAEKSLQTMQDVIEGRARAAMTACINKYCNAFNELNKDPKNPDFIRMAQYLKVVVIDDNKEATFSLSLYELLYKEAARSVLREKLWPSFYERELNKVEQILYGFIDKNMDPVSAMTELKEMLLNIQERMPKKDYKIPEAD